MTDKAGPSENAPVVPGPVAPPASQDPPSADLPPFVCILPCNAPPVKYFDRLDGCARGLHVTREDTKNLQLSLYGTMADVIMAKEDQSSRVGATAPDPCAVCKAPMVARPSFPLLYMENCVHSFHHGCVYIQTWDSKSFQCHQCGVESNRVLLWPGLFASEAAKRDTFQLQKRSLGLDVAPQTALEVSKSYVHNEFPAFDLTVNSKRLTLRKRSPPRERGWLKATPSVPGRDSCYGNGDVLVAELDRRWYALRQFWCPFDRRQDDGPNGGGCTDGNECIFWHESQTSRVLSRGQQPVPRPAFLRNFPRFFCERNSICNLGPGCTKRIRVQAQELDRCLAGFHPTVEDLENVDGFACKMAKLIMAPMVVPEPEQTLDCAFCHKPQAELDSVRMHLQNCGHWLHVSCLAQARLAYSANPNGRKLDLPCPTCQVSSVHMLAWPGPFQSDLMKQTIFGLQLEKFKLTVQADTQLEIVQLPNQVNVFTLDYGGPSVVTIDGATAPNNSTILYD